jgi:hypothetical protein
VKRCSLQPMSVTGSPPGPEEGHHSRSSITDVPGSPQR